MTDKITELIEACEAYLRSRRFVLREVDWDSYERLEKALKEVQNG